MSGLMEIAIIIERECLADILVRGKNGVPGEDLIDHLDDETHRAVGAIVR